MEPRLTLEPYTEFATAVRETLQLLKDQVGLSMWLVTRLCGEEAEVVEVVKTENLYAVTAGDRVRWADTICTRMVAQQGPQFAPYVGAVAEYRSAPLTSSVPVGAYLGIPLVASDGRLLGTLCGIDPRPQQTELFRRAEPVLRVMGRLLVSLLERDLERLSV